MTFDINKPFETTVDFCSRKSRFVFTSEINEKIHGMKHLVVVSSGHGGEDDTDWVDDKGEGIDYNYVNTPEPAKKIEELNNYGCSYAYSMWVDAFYKKINEVVKAVNQLIEERK